MKPPPAIFDARSPSYAERGNERVGPGAKRHNDDKSDARFKSRFTKPSRNTPDEIPPYEWHIHTDHNSGEVYVAYAPADNMAQFQKLISDGVVECTQIAEEMGVSPGTVSKLAHRAKGEGWLDKIGREYTLVERKLKTDGNEGNEE